VFGAAVSGTAPGDPTGTEIAAACVGVAGGGELLVAGAGALGAGGDGGEAGWAHMTAWVHATTQKIVLKVREDSARTFFV